MDDMIQLLVSGSNKKTTFKIHKDASVEDLMRKISEWNGVDSTSQRVIFAAKELVMTKDGKKMYLSDYKLQDRSQLFVVFQLPGGNDPDPPEGDVCQQKQLDEDVELTDLPDMITWDDDPTNQRAKMPCGHAIGPESLTAYCRCLQTAGKCQFHCPYIDRENLTYCGQIWDYFIVRRIAVLTDVEKKDFETKMSQNYMRKAAGIQECPKCTLFCMRKNSKDRRVVCLSCSNSGEMYEFCWYCLGDWKTLGITNCGNTACTGEDPRLKTLKEASLKAIVGLKGCPSIRACPKCGILIQHTEACKHMVCVCGQKFCFICLTKPGTDGFYRCGIYNSHCTIAPVQKKIFDADHDDGDPDVDKDEPAGEETERNIDTQTVSTNDDDSEINLFENEIVSIASTDNTVFTNTEADTWNQDESDESEPTESQIGSATTALPHKTRWSCTVM